MSWPGLARLCLYLFLLVTQVDSSLLAQRPRDKFCGECRCFDFFLSPAAVSPWLQSTDQFAGRRPQ